MGYTIYLRNDVGSIVAADWAKTKAQAQRMCEALCRKSVYDLLVVFAVNENTGEIVAGHTNVHQL